MLRVVNPIIQLMQSIDCIATQEWVYLQRGMFQNVDPSFRAYEVGLDNLSQPNSSSYIGYEIYCGMGTKEQAHGEAAFQTRGDYAYATGGKVYNGLYHLGRRISRVDNTYLS